MAAVAVVLVYFRLQPGRSDNLKTLASDIDRRESAVLARIGQLERDNANILRQNEGLRDDNAELRRINSLLIERLNNAEINTADIVQQLQRIDRRAEQRAANITVTVENKSGTVSLGDLTGRDKEVN